MHLGIHVFIPFRDSYRVEYKPVEVRTRQSIQSNNDKHYMKHMRTGVQTLETSKYPVNAMPNVGHVIIYDVRH